MHSKTDNIEIMINVKTDKVIKELFVSFKKKYQNNLELMKHSNLLFVYVHKIS